MKKAIKTLIGLCFVLSAFTAQASAFITKWQTTSANESITIPAGSGTFNYTVDWGDGTTPTLETGSATHAYVSAGLHTVSITGVFPQINFSSSLDAQKIISIEQWGTIAWTSMEGAFSGCINLTIPATDAPDLSNVLDMQRMFEECTNMTANINHWDVSNVTNMHRTFSNCGMNSPLNQWDVGNVTDMNNMFENAPYFNQPLDNWDVSNVLNMSSMFLIATSFDQPLGNWDVSNVANMGSMFDQFSGLSAANYDATLQGWSQLTFANTNLGFDAGTSTYCDAAARALLVSKIGTIADSGQAANCPGDYFITTWKSYDPFDYPNFPNLPVHINTVGGGFDYTVNWGDGIIDYNVTGDTSHTYSTNGTFTITISGDFPQFQFNSSQLQSVDQWGAQQWRDMNQAFYQCSSLDILATDAPDLSQVVSMAQMFNEAGLSNTNINHWDVSNVENMAFLFRESDFNSPLNNWDVSNVQNMDNMFSNAKSFNQNINNWDVSSVTNMHNMFEFAENFDQPLDNWDVSNVADMTYMFDFAGLSTQNYDALLGGWSQLTFAHTNLGFDAGSSTYCDAAARALLVSKIGTIDDAGLDAGCPSQPCTPISISFSASGLKPFWAPATDPYTFYYGLVDAKRINASVSGGVGPFTYTWSNTGSPWLLPRAYYPANTIDLFRPLAATTVSVDVFDAGTGCTHTASVFIDWDGQYHCSTPNSTWSVVVCENGVTKCLPWGAAKNKLKANPPTATLGACSPKTELATQVSNVSVYPNPSSGVFTLELPVASDTKGTVDVTDINGRLIYSESVDMQEGVFYHNLDLSSVPNGLYLVRVITNDSFITERIQVIR